VASAIHGPHRGLSPQDLLVVHGLELTFALLGICVTIACIAYVIAGIVIKKRWK
jgi:hypothetical protein